MVITMFLLMYSFLACGPKKELSTKVLPPQKETTTTIPNETALNESTTKTASNENTIEKPATTSPSTSTPITEETDELAWYEDAVEEVVVVDPKTQWPHKIILDSNAQQLMLVWFDEKSPTHVTLPFAAIQNLHSIPSDQGMGAELQLESTKKGSFLVAYNFGGTQQQSLLLSAVLGINVQNNASNEMRIATKDLSTRAEPKIVVGSIHDPSALEPIGKVIEDTLLHKSAVGEEIGENVPQKSTGALSRASVELEIKRNMSRFRSCYQKELAKIPDLQGTVQIQFSIGAEGSVLGARVLTSSLKNATAERCILRNIYGLRFDSPAGGTAVFTYPFTFTRL